MLLITQWTHALFYSYLLGHYFLLLLECNYFQVTLLCVDILAALPTSAGEDCAVTENDCCHCFFFSVIITNHFEQVLSKEASLLWTFTMFRLVSLFRLVYVCFSRSISSEITKTWMRHSTIQNDVNPPGLSPRTISIN